MWRVRVEKAAEDSRKDQNVVDLAGLVAPAGATTAACWRASDGSTSGSGLATAKTMAPSAIVATSSPMRMPAALTPIKTSVPANACRSEPGAPPDWSGRRGKPGCRGAPAAAARPRVAGVARGQERSIGGCTRLERGARPFACGVPARVVGGHEAGDRECRDEPDLLPQAPAREAAASSSRRTCCATKPACCTWCTAACHAASGSRRAIAFTTDRSS